MGVAAVYNFLSRESRERELITNVALFRWEERESRHKYRNSGCSPFARPGLTSLFDTIRSPRLRFTYSFAHRGRRSHGKASAEINKVVYTPDNDNDEEEEYHGGSSMTERCCEHQNEKEKTWWVPHPKSGIFHPEGHQKWIEGVNNCKKVREEEQNYWVRSLEDVTPLHHIDLSTYISSD